jgi:hypothetical protein
MPTTVADETAAETAFLDDGSEPNGVTADGATIRTNEMDQTPAGAKIDLWDSDWPGGRYYWTVMPVTPVADQGLTTTLTVPTVVGATTITVANAAGIGPTDHIQVGDAPVSEAAVVSWWPETRSPSSRLHSAHGIGEHVVRPSGGIKYTTPSWRRTPALQAGCSPFGKTNDPAVAGGDAVRLRPVADRHASSRPRPNRRSSTARR